MKSGLLRRVRIARSETIRSWPEVVDEARSEQGLSLDDLAYEARKYGASPALTGSQISQVKHGKRPYSIGFLEGLAGALAISPYKFGEYHLAKARELLDENRWGLEGAVRNIDALSQLMADEGDDAPSDKDPVELAGKLREYDRQQQSPGRVKEES